MQTTNLNPRNFKPGTVIVTSFETFTVDAVYKNSLLVIKKYASEETGKVQTGFIEFDFFNNRLFQKDIESITEPVSFYESPKFKGLASIDLCGVEEY